MRALLVPNSFAEWHTAPTYTSTRCHACWSLQSRMSENVRHCVCKSTASKISLRIMLPQGIRLDVIVRLRLSASLELLLVAFPRWNGCRRPVLGALPTLRGPKPSAAGGRALGPSNSCHPTIPLISVSSSDLTAANATPVVLVASKS